MSTKNKPGIHLLKRIVYIEETKKNKSWYWWHIVSKNGRIIARSSETYSRKSGAIASIKVAASIFKNGMSSCAYYDHSKPNSPLQSYL